MAPLHVAAKGARVGIVKYLVREGANINIQDHNKVSRHSRKGAVSILLLMPTDHMMLLDVKYFVDRFCASRIGGKGEVGGFRHRVLHAWWLLWLAIVDLS